MAQTIYLNMIPNTPTPRVYLKQGDIGETINFILLYGASEYTIPTGATVKLQGTKPSGLGFVLTCTASGNTATATLTETVTNEAGHVLAEVVVTKSGNVLASKTLVIDLERLAHPEGTTDGDLDHILPKYVNVTTVTLPAGDSATYSYDPETNTATFGIPKGADGSLASGVLADTYSTSRTYAVGDYVYYNGNLYRCSTAITTAEAWTSGHWTQVALANDVSDLKADINDNQTLTDELISKTTDFISLPYAYNNANKSTNVNSSGRIGLGNQTGRTTRIYDVSSLIGQVVMITCVIPANDDYGFAYAVSDTNGDCIGGGDSYPNGISFVKHRVVIPTGATYIYVTSLTTNLPSVEILGNAFDITNNSIQLNADTISNLINESVGLRSLPYIYNETDKSVNVNSQNNIGLGSQNGRTTRVYDISAFVGKVVYVSGTLPANDYYQRIYAVGDEDGVCVGGGEVFPDGVTLSNFRIVLPNNAVYLYVTSLTTSLPSAEVVSWSSLNRLDGKTAVTFGDSITWYDGHAYHGLDGSKEEGVIAKGYQSYMRELGMIVDNKGYDGHHLPDIVNDKILPTDFSGYDYATITSGANDSRYDIPVGEIEPIGQDHGTSTFIGSLQTGIEHILTSNPQTKILLMTPIRGWIYYPDGYPPAVRPSKSGDGVVEEKYADAIKAVGKFYGIPVLDWYNLVTVNELTRVWFIEDPDPDPTADPNPNPLGSLHPTTAGFKCMSGFLIETLKEVW